MGAPYCFLWATPEQGIDHRNSQEIVHLWAIILLVIQRKKDNIKAIETQIERVAGLSSCLLYDQEYNLKMKVISHKFREWDEIITDNGYDKRFPLLAQLIKKDLNNPQAKLEQQKEDESPQK